MNIRDIFKIILNNPYGSIFITDAKGDVVFVNLGAENLLGKKRRDLLGANVRTLLQEDFYNQSTVLECISHKKIVVGQLKVFHGKHFMSVSVPILNTQGDVIATNTFIAESPRMKVIMATAKRIAETDCNVLILGESGTGKDVLANYIHSQSLRADKSFIPINCATIPADLLESELFGYEKGAFTGANDKGKIGILEMANHGTLFLDEVGEMPLPLQAKFLRILETGEVQRLGSTVTKKIDFRLIAATNRNLLQMVHDGTFRDDLYYRLNVVPVTLPPLRERPEDMEALAMVFLQRFNMKYNATKKLDERAIHHLRQYDWPGNIRELQNVIERYIITNMDISSLVQLTAPSPQPDRQEENTAPFEFQDLKNYMRMVEREYIEKAVAACDGKIARAAEKLHVHRSMIYKKLNLKE